MRGLTTHTDGPARRNATCSRAVFRKVLVALILLLSASANLAAWKVEKIVYAASGNIDLRYSISGSDSVSFLSGSTVYFAAPSLLVSVTKSEQVDAEGHYIIAKHGSTVFVDKEDSRHDWNDGTWTRPVYGDGVDTIRVTGYRIRVFADTEYEPISVSFVRDSSPPSIHFADIPGESWSNGPTSATIWATDAGGSGWANRRYRIGNNATSTWSSWTNFSGTTVVNLPDGDRTLQVSAADTVGNTTTESRTYKLDTTPPDFPSGNLNAPILSRTDNGIKIDYSWEPANGALSGIEEYGIWVHTTSVSDPSIEDDLWTSQIGTAFVLDGVLPDTEYKTHFRARDNADNWSAWVSFDPAVYTPPTVDKLSVAGANGFVDVDDATSGFVLTLEGLRDHPSVDTYYVNRSHSQDTEGNPIWHEFEVPTDAFEFAGGDPDPVYLYSDAVSEDVPDSWPAHARVQYQLSRRWNFTESTFRDFTGSPTAAVELPNRYARFTLTLDPAGVPEPVVTITGNGDTASLDGGTETVATNVDKLETHFTLTSGRGDGEDDDGDTVLYKVSLDGVDVYDTGADPIAAEQVGELSAENMNQGVYALTVSTTEDAGDQSPSDRYYPKDYGTIGTIVVDRTPPQLPSHNLSLREDNDTLRPETGGHELTGQYQTPTREIEIDFLGGTALSGLDSLSGTRRLYIWNGEPDIMPDIAGFATQPVEGQKTYLDLSVPSSSLGAVVLEGSQSLESLLGNELLIHWMLSEGSGEKTVSIRVEDFAGNLSEAGGKSTVLDTTAPAKLGAEPQDEASHQHTILVEPNPPGAAIAYNWALTPPTNEEGVWFAVRVREGDAGDWSDVFVSTPEVFSPLVTGEFLATQISLGVPIESLPSNHPVEIGISVLDAAGNASDEAFYKAYTLPTMGTLSGATQSYDSTDGHMLEWSLVDPGVASVHILERLHLSDGSVQESIAVSTDGTVEFAGLSPRGVYRFRLVAHNSAPIFNGVEITDRTDTVAGDTFDVTLANNPPTVPVPQTPGGFVRPTPLVFDWGGSTDADGDFVSYDIYLADGDTQDLGQFSLANTAPIVESFVDADSPLFDYPLTDGDSYSWYVVASDRVFDGDLLADPQPDWVAESEISTILSFSIDGAAPQVTFGTDEFGAYTNADSVTLDVSDRGAGLQTVGGQPFVTFQTNGQGDFQDLVLTEVGPDGDSIIYSGSLDLPPTEGTTFSVIARDAAGNESETTSPLIQSDRIAPQFSTVTVDLPTVAGKSIASSQLLPISVSASDDYSGVRRLGYVLTQTGGSGEVRTGEIPVTDFPPVSPDPTIESLQTSVNIGGTDGDEWQLSLTVEDWAGNTVGHDVTVPILLALTAPEGEVSVSGLVESGGRLFASDTTTLSVDFLPFVADLADLVVEFALSDGGTQTSWYPAAADIPPSFGDGSEIRFVVRATDQNGITATALSVPFVLDTSVPAVPVITVRPVGEIVPGESVRLEISSSDVDSGLSEIRIAIGAGPDGTDVSGLINGNFAGWLTFTNSESGIISFSMPPVTSGIYTVSAYATNRAGLASGRGDAPVVVNDTLERVAVWDEGPYEINDGHLIAGWSFNGAESVAAWEYRIERDGVPLGDWVQTPDGGVEVALVLDDGVGYVVRVRARFSDDSVSADAVSGGVVFDASPPELADFVTPRVSTTADLWATWAASDPETAIGRVQILLETRNQEGDLEPIGPWTDLGAADTGNEVPVRVAGLSEVASGTRVYPTIRATNKVGLTRDVSAPAIVIDETPPPVPLVVDQGGAINAAQAPVFNWIWSEADAESGTSYHWTVIEGPEEIETATWYGDNGDRVIDLGGSEADEYGFAPGPGLHGTTLFFAVRATDDAGYETIGVSDGITFDVTAPFVSEVLLLTGQTGAENVQNLRDTSSLWGRMNAVEDVSGISSYTFELGRLSAVGEYESIASAVGPVSSVAELVVPDGLQNGDILVIRGSADNEAGLATVGFSMGSRVDDSYPRVADVTGRASGGVLYFDWIGQSDFWPIVEYEVALMDLVSEPLVDDWQTVGIEQSVSYDVAVSGLQDGAYRLFVRATNEAGVVSRDTEWGVSSVVAIDTSAPGVSLVYYQEFTSQYTEFQATASEPESGVREYQYAVGTRDDEFAFSGGWNSIFSRNIFIEQIVRYDELQRENPRDKTEVFLRIRVQNTYGLWSGVAESGPIVVDRSPPNQPEVGKGPYNTFDYQVTGISLLSDDAESSVTHFRVAIVDDTTVSDLPPETGQPVGDGPVAILDLSDHVVGGLSLDDAGRYFVAVQTRNGAGDWSQVGTSAEFVVDITDPVLQFTDEERVENHVPVDAAFDLSEDAYVTITVVDPSGGVTEHDLGLLDAGTGVFQFNDPAYGTHTISALVTDLAGNIGNQGQDASVVALRVNEPPVVILPVNYVTRPGAPLTIVAQEAYDPDGDDISFEWTLGPLGDPALWSIGPPPDPSAPEPTVSYIHEDPLGGSTRYAISVTVTDEYGLATSADGFVDVFNTSAGMLYVDEYWLDGHLVTGDVIVPAGIVLTIVPAAEVIVAANQDVHPRVTIEGQLVATGATVRASVGNTARWDGILVSGAADLTGGRVSGADRGLTVVPGGTAILDTTLFDDNRIGAHFVGVAPNVTSSTFQQNEHYGIKEDAGANPVLTDNYFVDNGYDYYDEELTVLSADQLNDLGSNSGNAGE